MVVAIRCVDEQRRAVDDAEVAGERDRVVGQDVACGQVAGGSCEDQRRLQRLIDDRVRDFGEIGAGAEHVVIVGHRVVRHRAGIDDDLCLRGAAKGVQQVAREGIVDQQTVVQMQVVAAAVARRRIGIEAEQREALVPAHREAARRQRAGRRDMNRPGWIAGRGNVVVDLVAGRARRAGDRIHGPVATIRI